MGNRQCQVDSLFQQNFYDHRLVYQILAQKLSIDSNIQQLITEHQNNINQSNQTLNGFIQKVFDSHSDFIVNVQYEYVIDIYQLKVKMGFFNYQQSHSEFIVISNKGLYYVKEDDIRCIKWVQLEKVYYDLVNNVLVFYYLNISNESVDYYRIISFPFSKSQQLLGLIKQLLKVYYMKEIKIIFIQNQEISIDQIQKQCDQLHLKEIEKKEFQKQMFQKQIFQNHLNRQTVHKIFIIYKLQKNQQLRERYLVISDQYLHTFQNPTLKITNTIDLDQIVRIKISKQFECFSIYNGKKWDLYISKYSWQIVDIILFYQRKRSQVKIKLVYQTSEQIYQSVMKQLMTLTQTTIPKNNNENNYSLNMITMDECMTTKQQEILIKHSTN